MFLILFQLIRPWVESKIANQRAGDVYSVFGRRERFDNIGSGLQAYRFGVVAKIQQRK